MEHKNFLINDRCFVAGRQGYPTGLPILARMIFVAVNVMWYGRTLPIVVVYKTTALRDLPEHGPRGITISANRLAL